MKKVILGIMLLILSTASVFADEIVLRSGMTVNDPITDRSDKWVKVDVGGVTVTYYNDEIESINGKTMTAAPAPSAVKAQDPTVPPVVEAAPPFEQPAALTEVQAPASVVVVETNSPPAPLPVAAAAPVLKTTVTDPIQTQPSFSGNIPSVSSVTTSSSSSITKKRPLKPAQAALGIGVMLIIFVLAFGVFVYPVYLIAKKTGIGYPFFAFIPILNYYLLIQISGRPVWWLILYFVPLVSIIIDVMVWMDIAVVRKKPAWMGLLVLVPVANLGMMWYLALSDSEMK